MGLWSWWGIKIVWGGVKHRGRFWSRVECVGVGYLKDNVLRDAEPQSYQVKSINLPHPAYSLHEEALVQYSVDKLYGVAIRPSSISLQ